MTQAQFQEINQAMGAYLGNNTYSQVAMLSPAEYQQVLKDTNTKNQTDTMSTIKNNIQQLTSGLPAPYQQNIQANASAGQYYQQQEQATPEYQAYNQANQYVSQLIQKGPMFELAMRPELAKISPTFMGANVRDLTKRLHDSGIEDPFVVQNMVGNYMKYADKSMTTMLSYLGQLRDATLIAAQTDAESKKADWERIAKIYDDAYSATIMANKDILESKLNPKSGANGMPDYVKDADGNLMQWDPTLQLLIPAKIQVVPLTDIQMRDNFQTLKDNKKTYEYQVSQIDDASDIVDKVKAKQILDEVYGKKSNPMSTTSGITNPTSLGNWIREKAGFGPTGVFSGNTPEKLKIQQETDQNVANAIAEQDKWFSNFWNSLTGKQMPDQIKSFNEEYSSSTKL